MEAIIGVQVRRKDTLSREYHYTHFSANTSLTTHTRNAAEKYYSVWEKFAFLLWLFFLFSLQ